MGCVDVSNLVRWAINRAVARLLKPMNKPQPTQINMTKLLAALRAATQMTRLRILSVLGNSELTVSELMQILEQRHLLGQQARKRIENNFALSAIVDQYEDLYGK